MLTVLVVGVNYAASGNSDANPLSNDNTQTGPTHKVIAMPGLLNPGQEGISLWHDYGSFALYKVSVEALQGLSAEVRGSVVTADDMDSLMFDSFQIDTQSPFMQMAADTVTGDEAALQLVQFVGPIKEEWLDAVRATGASTIQYIASNGYLLWADGASRQKLDAMAADGDFLQYSAPYPTSLKIGPNLAARDNPDEVVPVVIQIYRHDGAGASEAAVHSVTLEQFSGWTPILEFQNLYATMQVGDFGIYTAPTELLTRR